MPKISASQPINAKSIRLAAIVESSDDAIVSKTLDGIVVSWNQSAERLFGYSAEEMIGQSITVLFPKDRIKEEAYFLEQIKNNQHIQHYETERINKNGELLSISVSLSPIIDENGNILGVSKIARDISLQKNLQKKLAEKLEILNELVQDRDRAHKQQTELAAHIITRVEQERHKISREIHDDLGGNLTAIKISIASLAGQIDNTLPALIEKIRYIESIVDHTFEMVHRISRDLWPNILGLGIVDALEWQASEFDRHTGIACSFTTNDENIELDEEKTMGLFRVCQEALSNIAKHAKANLVTVELTRFAGEIKMQITDDGIGISASDQHKKNAFGIHGMSERVTSLKGILSIQSGSKNGTKVMVILPK
jgi:PAS domain S-box-containing protein